MEMQFNFKGTPGQFGLICRELSSTLIATKFHNPFDVIKPRIGGFSQSKGKWVGGISPEDLKYSSFVEVEIILPGDSLARGTITAQIQPDESTLLAVYVKDEYWSRVSGWWKLLESEMRKQSLELSAPNISLTDTTIEQQIASGAVQSPDVVPAKPINKRGKRSRYTQEEKDALVMKWDKTDKDADSQNLDVFLLEETGEIGETGKPFVKTSTFYRWRTDFYKRNLNWTPELDSRKKKRKKIK